MLKKLSNVVIEGAWSAGLALLVTQGVVSPLAIVITCGIFGVQAATGFPLTNGLRSLKDKLVQFYDNRIDGDYQPAQGPMEEEEFYDEYGRVKENEEKINDGIRAELYDTHVETFAPASGFRRIPGMTWLFGEKKVTHSIPQMDPIEIQNIKDGATRSGKINFRTGERIKKASEPRQSVRVAPF
ncbi:MAG: hypothetical protein AB7I18_07585 [Candidatus Berkiella sp.]